MRGVLKGIDFLDPTSLSKQGEDHVLKDYKQAGVSSSICYIQEMQKRTHKILQQLGQ